MARRGRMCALSTSPLTSCDKRVTDAPSTHESLAKVAGRTRSFTTFLRVFFPSSLSLSLLQTSQFQISHFMGLCRVTEELFQNHRCIHSHTHTHTIWMFSADLSNWGRQTSTVVRKQKASSWLGRRLFHLEFFFFFFFLRAAVRHETGI